MTPSSPLAPFLFGRTLAGAIIRKKNVSLTYHSKQTDVFPSVGNTADWAAVRQTKNYQSNGPVTDVASPDMRCYQMLGAAQIVNVTAGSTLAYNAKTSISHPGPMAFYIAKVPAGQSVLDWDADGKVWSKIYQDQPILSASSITFPSQGKSLRTTEEE